MARRSQWITVGGIVLLLAVLIGAAWVVRDRFLPVEVGTRAPEFTARDLQGKPVALSDLRGQVVLLNIWATWCGPCREEMPSMERLHERFEKDGLRVVAVSIDQPDASPARNAVVADFVRDYDLTFDVWHDPSGKIQRTYRTTGVPESFVIDRRGVIQKKVIGATEWDSGPHADLIGRLLAE